jgi:hypothetical protein
VDRPTPSDRAERYCIVGAGPAGLCAARSLRRAGIPYDQLERHTDVGGMWDITNPSSAMYASAHMISTRRSSELSDFRMPADAPDYPAHPLVLRYFRDFAREFGLYEHLTCGAAVTHVAPRGARWEVTLAGETTRRYRGVIIANGHQFDPRMPVIPGSFDGELLHAFSYKSARTFSGKRVLVIGAGNSGCDIVLDAVHHGAAALLSMRRGYHVVPKYGPFGIPMGDLGGRLPLPRRMERSAARLVLRCLIGRPSRLGLPEPDHELTERHAIVNSQLLYHVGHGDVRIKPDVAELRGDRVAFRDGSEEAVDLIVCATGYRVSFPFLEDGLLQGECEPPELYLQIFHPRHPDLFVMGLVESVDGGNWRLFAAQADLIANYLVLRDGEARRVEAFERIKAVPPGPTSGCARPLYVRNRSYLRALASASAVLNGRRAGRRPAPAQLPSASSTTGGGSRTTAPGSH